MLSRTIEREQNEDILLVCQKINDCVRLVKLCDSMLFDHNGRSRDPNYITTAEKRIILRKEKGSDVNKYVAYRRGPFVYLRKTGAKENPEEDPHMLATELMARSEAERAKSKKGNNGFDNLEDLSSLRSEYALRYGNIGTGIDNSMQINLQNNSNLVKVLNNLATVVKLITATVATLAAIRTGSREVVNGARQGVQALRGIGSKIANFMLNIAKAKK